MKLELKRDDWRPKPPDQTEVCPNCQQYISGANLRCLNDCYQRGLTGGHVRRYYRLWAVSNRDLHLDCINMGASLVTYSAVSGPSYYLSITASPNTLDYLESEYNLEIRKT